MSYESESLIRSLESIYNEYMNEYTQLHEEAVNLNKKYRFFKAVERESSANKQLYMALGVMKAINRIEAIDKYDLY